MPQCKVFHAPSNKYSNPQWFREARQMVFQNRDFEASVPLALA